MRFLDFRDFLDIQLDYLSVIGREEAGGIPLKGYFLRNNEYLIFIVGETNEER